MHCDKQDLSTPAGLQVTDEIPQKVKGREANESYRPSSGRNLSSICIRTQKIRRHIQKQAKLVSKAQQLPKAASVTLVRASALLLEYSDHILSL